MLNLPHIQEKLNNGTVTKEDMQEVVRALRGDREVAQSLREVKKAKKERKADLDEWMGASAEGGSKPVTTDTKASVKSSGTSTASVLDSFLTPAPGGNP